MEPTTTIITSMYNRKQEVLEIIDKLFFPSLTTNGNKEMGLIIIDDCSPLKDETEGLVSKHLPILKNVFRFVTFVRNESNLGFGKSFNRGLEMTKTKNILLVNDDLYFPHESIQKLIDTLSESTNYGLVGPISNSPIMWSYQYCKQAPRITSYSTQEFWKLEKFSLWLSKNMHGKRTTTDHHLCGFCFAADTAFLKEFGGFDPKYQYGCFEDTDLVARILAKYGESKLGINMEVFIGHGGPSGNSRTLFQQPVRMIYHNLINGFIFAKRWGFKKYFKIVSFGMQSQRNGKGTISELLPEKINF